MQILADIYARFDSTIASSAQLQDLSLSVFLEVMASAPLSVRKRAVPALASFISICPQHFRSLKSEMAQGFAKGGDSAKAWVAAVAGIAKTSAASDVGALIANDDLVDVILKQADDLEDADAVEGALTVRVISSTGQLTHRLLRRWRFTAPQNSHPMSPRSLIAPLSL